jgi:inositol transport system ATP-binding protein
MSDTKIELRDIHKSFPGVHALKGVSFRVRPGTVHALCGENGAGKSTLMKIINGIYQAEEGEIFLDGERTVIRSPLDAHAKGIAMIAQELNFVPSMTVAESFFVGRLPTRFGKVDWRFVRSEARKILKAESLDYDIDQELRNLTVSDIQMLEILRAVYHKADVIIMDEPTSAIAHREVAILFEKIAELKARGVSIVYISHKMDEVFQVADDITILRDGAVVSTDRADDISMDIVVTRMVGRQLENHYPKEQLDLGDEVLRVTGLRRDDTFEDIDLAIRAGEIVGLAGLVGAGRSEVVRAIFGLDKLDGGDVFVAGTQVKVRSPRVAIRNRMALLGEDRRLMGIVPKLSVKENATLAALKRVVFKGRSHPRLERSLVTDYFARMNVRTPSLDTPIDSLSGGNQQKVLLARWLITDPQVLLLDEPTRGVDVGAKFEIYRLMTEFAREGRGVLMISSELPELIGMCDRIYVMSGGRLTGELDQPEFSQETILRYAMDES